MGLRKRNKPKKSINNNPDPIFKNNNNKVQHPNSSILYNFKKLALYTLFFVIFIFAGQYYLSKNGILIETDEPKVTEKSSKNSKNVEIQSANEPQKQSNEAENENDNDDPNQNIFVSRLTTGQLKDYNHQIQK